MNISSFTNPVSAVASVISGALDTLFGWVPVWAWLLVLGFAFGHGYIVTGQRDAARADLATLQGAVKQQKTQAKALFDDLKAKADALTELFNQLHQKVEAQSAKDRKTNQDLRDELRRNSRAAGGPGLRDPWAQGSGCGPSSAESPGQGAAGTNGGPGNPPEAGRVLSEPLEAMLLEDYAASDDINIAYAACRADAIMLRQTNSQLSPVASPP